ALSANKKWDKGDVVLGSRAVKALKPGKKHTVKARSVRVAAATRPGTYWLLACADAKKKVRESHERNNCRVAKKRVTVTKRMPAAPRDGVVKVNVRGHVDWKDRTRHTAGNTTTEIDSAATFDFNVPAKLRYVQGRPFYLEVMWDKGTVSGRTVYKRVNNDGCRDTTTADVRVAGEPAGLSQVLVHFPVPGRPSMFGQFALTFISQATTPYTSVDCEGDTTTSGAMHLKVVDTPDELPSVSANADLSRIVLKGGGAPRTHPGRTWEATVTLDITHPR
ncbi:CARDB domain-containing protein, partial [Mumia zhuanghuii]|uniref:CARDB domain-containing protein n=1 Tax=Mumia zhuanghuii TaxID=2585211 RepID=UPI001891CB2A